VADPTGILECPCNSRFGGDDLFYENVTTSMHTHGKTKVISEQMMAIPNGTCDTAKAKGFAAAVDCYVAIASIGAGPAKITNATGSDATKPAGCSLAKKADGSAEAFYNTASTKAACTTAGKKVASAVSEATKVTLEVEMEEESVTITIKVCTITILWL
jgi:hypothetical protein